MIDAGLPLMRDDVRLRPTVRRPAENNARGRRVEAALTRGKSPAIPTPSRVCALIKPICRPVVSGAGDESPDKAADWLSSPLQAIDVAQMLDGAQDAIARNHRTLNTRDCPCIR